MIEKVKKYLEKADLYELMGIVQEINSYDGSLEYIETYNNDEEFFDMFYHNRAIEAVRATQYGEYNFNDPYVGFNGYGNLVTYTELELRQEFMDYLDEIAESIIELQGNL